MKAPIKQKQFLIAKENGEEYVDNFYILFVGDVPGSVERENLVPGDFKEAEELAELHDMVVYTTTFCIDIGTHPWKDDKRMGMILATDHKGNVQYFHLPKGSIFKGMTLRELCEYHGWGYYDLKEATQSIRFCYDL